VIASDQSAIDRAPAEGRQAAIPRCRTRSARGQVDKINLDARQTALTTELQQLYGAAGRRPSAAGSGTGGS